MASPERAATTSSDPTAGAGNPAAGAPGAGPGSLGRGVVVATDFGAKRIGLAVSDASRTFVFPRGVVARDAAAAADVAAIRTLCRDEGARLIVVGLPLNVDGSEGDAARAARAFGAALAGATALPVAFVDERYTSLEADEALRARIRDPKERKARVDAAAATLILRTFLDHGPVA